MAVVVDEAVAASTVTTITRATDSLLTTSTSTQEHKALRRRRHPQAPMVKLIHMRLVSIALDFSRTLPRRARD